VKDVMNGPEQLLDREGLLEGGARAQHTRDREIGVGPGCAGHRNDSYVRIGFTQLLDQLETVRFRHNNFREYKLGFSRSQ
jgi:hypothetical protein